jgi:hypothetical protein
VKLFRRVLQVLLCISVLLIWTGCSGVNASGSVSPLMFLVPGLGQTKPETPEEVAEPEPSVFLAGTH